MPRSSLLRLIVPLAAIVVGATACSTASREDTDESRGAATGGSTANGTSFVLDAPWSCSVQDMTTLAMTPTTVSPGDVKITMTFDGNPAVPDQVDAIVASRPANVFRKVGKVNAGAVSLKVERDSIDGQNRSLTTTLGIADLEGSVNADKSGSESPYRLYYEVNGGFPARPAAPQSDAAFDEDFAVVLYNIGNAGKSFTLVASAMREIDEPNARKELHCTARATFADPQTGQLPQ